MWEEEFTKKEFPTEATRVAHWWLRDLKRDNTTPKLHHNTWARDAEVSIKDRTFHEHEALTDIAEAFVCVDQLNCSSLFGYEKLVRRIMLLEEATGEPGTAPNWEGAEFWSESRPRGGGRIAPQMQKHVASRQAERNAREKEKRRAAEFKAFVPKRGKKGDGKKGADADGG